MEKTLEIASKEIGVRSDIHGKPNPRLLDYCAKLGIAYQPGLDEVWCALFVGFVLETCGIHSTKALNARSYLTWGTAEKVPKPGDVVVFWRDSVDSANGHVSFFHHQEGGFVYCLGGNQGSGIVDIEKYPISRVLAYRSAITTNTNTHMEPETITPATPQVLKLTKVTVHFMEMHGDQETAGDIEIPVTPEIVAAVQAVQAPEYNITVEAA